MEGVLGLGRKLSLQHCASSLVVVSRSVQPRVTLELVNSVALAGIVAEKASDEVLEVSREPSAVHLFEVGVDLASSEEVIEELLLASLLEWEDALNDNEEDDCH